MGTYFKPTRLLTDEEKKQVSEMSGKLVTWISEGRPTDYMAKQLHLNPLQVEQNINEMMYTLKKRVGFKRFLGILLWK